MIQNKGGRRSRDPKFHIGCRVRADSSGSCHCLPNVLTSHAKEHLYYFSVTVSAQIRFSNPFMIGLKLKLKINEPMTLIFRSGSRA
jgi:hypothetical protein